MGSGIAKFWLTSWQVINWTCAVIYSVMIGVEWHLFCWSFGVAGNYWFRRRTWSITCRGAENTGAPSVLYRVLLVARGSPSHFTVPHSHSQTFQEPRPQSLTCTDCSYARWHRFWLPTIVPWGLDQASILTPSSYALTMQSEKEIQSPRSLQNLKMAWPSQLSIKRASLTKCPTLQMLWTYAYCPWLTYICILKNMYRSAEPSRSNTTTSLTERAKELLSTQIRSKTPISTSWSVSKWSIRPSPITHLLNSRLLRTWIPRLTLPRSMVTLSSQVSPIFDYSRIGC